MRWFPLLLVACADVWELPGEVDSGTHTDPIATTQTTDTPTTTTPLPGPIGATGLCAGGGYARGETYAVMSCTAPVSAAGVVATDGSLFWEPGLMSWVTP